jgi:hypothetical protein
MLVFRLVLSAAALAASLYGDDWAKTFNVTGTPDLRVETDDGSVTMRTGTEGKVVARVTTTGWKIGPGEVTVREFQNGGRVELTVHSPHMHLGFGSIHRSIHVEVEVPRQANMDVRTGDGAIEIHGVAGEARLHTGDGHIEGEGLDGALKAETGDGHVRVRGRFDQLTVHTGDGGIEADVLPGSKMSLGWRIETGDGHVTVRLPRDFAAELDAHTGDGHLSVDFPATTNANSRRNNEFRGRINGGGPVFSIRTNDGSIQVKAL